MEIIPKIWKDVLTLNIGPEDKAADVIWMAIRTGIIDKKLALGSSVPPYRQIAELMGLHKSILAKVMSRLKEEKLIVTNRRRGTNIVDHLPNKRGASKNKLKAQEDRIPKETLSFDQRTLTQKNKLTLKLNNAYHSATRHSQNLTAKELNMTTFPLLTERLTAWSNNVLKSYLTEKQVFYGQGYPNFLHIICAALLPPKMMIVVACPLPRQVLTAIDLGTASVEYVYTGQDSIPIDELEKCCRQGRVGMVYMSSRLPCPFNFLQLQEKITRLLDLQNKYGFVILEDDRYAGFYEYMPNILMDRTKGTNAKIVYFRPLTLSQLEMNRINIITGPEKLIGQVIKKCQKTGFVLDSVTAHAVQEILSTSLLAKMGRRVRREIGAANKTICDILLNSALWEAEGCCYKLGWFFYLVPRKGRFPEDVYKLLENNGFSVPDLHVFDTLPELQRGILISTAAYVGNEHLERDLNSLNQFLKNIIC